MKKVFYNEEIPGLHIRRFLALFGTDRIFAEVEFENSIRQQNKKVLIPFSELKSTRLKNYIPEFFTMPNVLPEDMHKFIALRINDVWSVENKPFKTMFPPGYSYVDNKWVYAIGNTVIGSDVSTPAYSLQDFSLSHKENLENSWIWVERFCNSGRAHAALFLCSLTPLLYPITSALGFQSHVAHAYVLGRSGCGKTSFSKLLTSAFGHNGINLGSKKNKFFKSLSTPHIPLLVDDLNKTESNREYESKLKLACESISSTSCGGTIFTDDGILSLDQSSLILTAEVLVNIPSKINRMVLVKFDDNLEAEDLNFLQQESHHYKNFIYHFICWICRHHKVLTKQIESENQQLYFDLKVAHNGASKYVGFSRIAYSNKLLKIMSNIVMMFLCNNNVPKKNLEILNKIFNNSIDGAIQDTLEAVKASSSGSSVIDFIIDIFAYDINEVIAKDYYEYIKSKKISVQEKLFFRYKKMYIFRLDEVAAYISHKTGNDISSSELLNELSKANLLKYNKEGYQPHLPQKLREESENNKRYSRLNLEVLSGLVEGIYCKISDACNSPIPELRPLSK